MKITNSETGKTVTFTLYGEVTKERFEEERKILLHRVQQLQGR